ncbi:hypothetical protein G3I40_32290 [Streptomyces sp. SID14478]|uniref:hypothetical protein n=1 Tax=Streptomyces sp. SID14478 TaxID=2706073 RepID=UPI0013DD608B|nr:hypothetical protein [Streptomyces sp. SID14478]NEB79864.1 hypothetical protein [Streptomyces sp. SID14478]
MAGMRGVRTMGATLLAAALAVGAAGCSDSDTSPSDAASKVGEVVSSATAEAQKKVDEFKDGTDAKGEVKLGDVRKDDGRATVPVTVTNGQSSQKSYLVLVAFKDSGGNTLDTVALNVNDVAANASKQASARSHRSLDGDVKADIVRALRH